MIESRKAREQRIGPPVAGGCVSIRLKFFWFLLFTTDAASECNANVVCKLPSGEEEPSSVPRAETVYGLCRGSTRKPKATRSQKEQYQPGQCLDRAPRLKREIVKTCWRVLTRFPRRAKKRRSDSGAAVKRTRGGELGCALGCDCSLDSKTVVGFRAALGRAWG